MHLSLQSVLRSCVALLLGCLVSFPSTALATSVGFSGTVGYSSDYQSFTVLAIDGIRNSSSTTSASLRVELWASQTGFTGFAGAVRTAVYTVGPLAGGVTTTKITPSTSLTATLRRQSQAAASTAAVVRNPSPTACSKSHGRPRNMSTSLVQR